MNMIARETTVMSIDKFCLGHKVLASEIRLTNPINCNGRAIDIGSLTYSVRQWTKQVNAQHINLPNLVDISTFRAERSFCVLNLATELQQLRPRSQNSLLKEIMPVFDWMDCNNCIDFLCSEVSFIKGYKSYTQYLIDRMKSKDHPSPITDRTAKDKQWICRRIARAAFPNNYQRIWSSEIVLKSNQQGKTPIPDEKVMQLWEVYYETFNKLKNQCFSNDLFPPVLKTSTLKSAIMYFDSQYIRFISPHRKYIVDSNKRVNMTMIPFLNYQTGKIDKAHPDYVRNLYNIQGLIENPRDPKRLTLAKIAMYAFHELFRILTRVNRAQMIELPFSPNYSVEKDITNIEFKAIKYRANNREITLRIEKHGVKLFKEYLKLRSWILKGKKCKHLFFYLIGSTPKPLCKQFSYRFNKQLRLVGILSSTTSPLKDIDIRQASTIFSKEKGYSNRDVALSNNHSEAVSETTYSTPSIEKQIQELDSYWLAVGKVSLFHKKTREEIPTISGNCKAGDKAPESVITGSPIEPNCNTPQGCFFCKYYACHADENDIRKILNVLFVVKLLWNNASDIEHSEETYSLLILHLERLLSEIKSLSKESKCLVERLTHEIIQNGYLLPFWENRLDYFEDIGLLKI